MKLVYELGVYKPAEKLSDIVWHHFDKWNKSWKTRPKIEYGHQQYKTMKAKFPISIF